MLLHPDVFIYLIQLVLRDMDSVPDPVRSIHFPDGIRLNWPGELDPRIESSELSKFIFYNWINLNIFVWSVSYGYVKRYLVIWESRLIICKLVKKIIQNIASLQIGLDW